MGWGRFAQLMKECTQHDVYGISLYMLGEPMLWRDVVGGQALTIFTLISDAKRAGFKAINISTNGDVTNLGYLIRSDLSDLIISIDGTTAAVYDANRPSTTPNDTHAFERTLDRVHTFLAEKAKSGEAKPFVRLQIINKENTRDQILDFIRTWIDVLGVDDVFVKNLDSMRPWLGAKVVSDDEDAIKAAALGAMPCQHIYSVGTMTVDGHFAACCHDAKDELQTAHANIDEMTFADWWNGGYLNALRAEHNAGTFRHPCKSCRERDTWLG